MLRPRLVRMMVICDEHPAHGVRAATSSTPGTAMWKRWGTGPVFKYEMLLDSRRRQVYEGRALFVLLVLFGLLWVWFIFDNAPTGSRASIYQQMAQLGEWFFYTMAGIQISVVMLVAPAATAGSICIDRARGTLLHMLMTDISNVEIVLGKLGARLAPLIGIILCGVPVAALTALLGGIQFGSIAVVFGISLALAVLGCTFAITVSVWARKTHDVLITVFIIEGFWVLLLPLWHALASSLTFVAPPDWIRKSNPYVLIFAQFNQPDFVSAQDYLVFIGVMLAISVGMAILSVIKLRRVVVEQPGRAYLPAPRRSKLSHAFLSWSGPSLEGNPVLWREWHRSMPSRLDRVLWISIFTLTWALAAWGTCQFICDNTTTLSNRYLGIGACLQLLVGTLILSATAPTMLAEERVRGSLDVLLSTPLSTRSIVIGKWLGGCRGALVMAILPLYTAVFMACTTPDSPSWIARFPQSQADVVPLSALDRVLAVAFCGFDFAVSCALIVSLGLLIATWVPRLGRAVAMSVIAFFVTGVGWIVLVEIVLRPLLIGTSVEMIRRYGWLETCAMSMSPIYGPLNPISVLETYSHTSRAPIWGGLLLVVLAKAAIIGTLVWLTIRTFDRAMGRISERRDPERNLEPAVRAELVPIAI